MVTGAKSIDFYRFFGPENSEKRFENDLPGHLQSSEFAYAEVHGWQTIPQWSRGSRIQILICFLALKI